LPAILLEFLCLSDIILDLWFVKRLGFKGRYKPITHNSSLSY
jgi:hypothetical protein